MARNTNHPHQDALIRRLSPYWKMEAVNIFLVPAFAVFAVRWLGDGISGSMVVAMAATSFMLLIGTAALYLHLQTVKRRREFGVWALPRLSAAQRPALALVILSIIGARFELWVDHRFSASAIATMACAFLALLEYVNYYHVQLQNFDHIADLKRIFRGGHLREAHLAKALRRFRARQVR
jgi:hypothetical protein